MRFFTFLVILASFSFGFNFHTSDVAPDLSDTIIDRTERSANSVITIPNGDD